MKIGFDLAQAASTPAGCGWYTRSLLQAMADQPGNWEFLAYRHFGHWLNPPATLAPLPASPRVHDPQADLPPASLATEWARARATEEFPGRPDLVHSTSFQAPRTGHARLVVTVFDLSFWAVPDFTTNGIRLDCQRGILDALGHAAGLIFISEHARQEFHRFLPRFRRRSEIVTIVTPLASRWPIVAKPAEGIGHYWLFVGSQEPRKNISGLLDAYEAYVHGHPHPLPLWLAGGAGWKNESWQTRLAALEGRGLVRRLGYVPDHELPALYRQAAGLIFPSWYEGFGLPVLEAMSQGCPVICSNRSSLPETGGDAPLYIDPAQPAEIHAAMRQLEEQAAQWRECARRGLAQAEGFSWVATAKQTLAFYERILSAV